MLGVQDQVGTVIERNMHVKLLLYMESTVVSSLSHTDHPHNRPKLVLDKTHGLSCA